MTQSLASEHTEESLAHEHDSLPPMVTSRQKIWRRFKRHRLAIVGGVILAIFYLFALFADFVSPYGYASDNRNRAYAPPSHVYMVAPKGGLTAPYMFEVKEVF